MLNYVAKTYKVPATRAEESGETMINNEASAVREAAQRVTSALSTGRPVLITEDDRFGIHLLRVIACSNDLSWFGFQGVPDTISTLADITVGRQFGWPNPKGGFTIETIETVPTALEDGFLPAAENWMRSVCERDRPYIVMNELDKFIGDAAEHHLRFLAQVIADRRLGELPIPAKVGFVGTLSPGGRRVLGEKVPELLDCFLECDLGDLLIELQMATLLTRMTSGPVLVTKPLACMPTESEQGEAQVAQDEVASTPRTVKERLAQQLSEYSHLYPLPELDPAWREEIGDDCLLVPRG
jgi:hypothetical protein